MSDTDDYGYPRESRRQTAYRILSRLTLTDPDAELLQVQQKARAATEAERLERHDEFYHIDTSDSAIGRRLHYSVGDDGGRDD